MFRPALLLVAAALLVAPTRTSAQTYLKASNTGAGDFFGWSVAVSGDTAVVGALHEDSAATGVNGNQSSNTSLDSGAVYVFVHGGIWTQQAYIKPSNTQPGDSFGWSTSISGDTLVVGSSGRSQAYVFVRSGATWTQQALLTASNFDSADGFGRSVSISGNTLVVGASDEDGAVGGVNGDQSSNGAKNSGAAYVFVRSGTSWTQQAYLKASFPGASDAFGTTASIDGDTIVVGAASEDSNATGVDGDASNDFATDSGAAYVFVRNGTSWSQQAYLKASNTMGGDEFGISVSVSGDTIAVGAHLENSNATGVNGQTTGAAIDSGSAYIFTRSGTSWSQQAYVKASNTGAADEFGYAVSVSGNRVVVGARAEASNATGVNGDQSNNAAPAAGAAYSFVRNAGTWAQESYLKASNTGGGDLFGMHLALSGDTLLVGSYWEDSATTGVDGDGSNNQFMDAGAAYVHTLPTLGPWTNMGSGLAGVSGIPSLVGSGTLASNSSDAVNLTGAAPSAPAALFVSLSSTPAPFKGGTLLPLPSILIVFAATAPSGTIPLPFVMPAGVPTGTQLWMQWAVQDAAAVHGTSLSNGVRGVTP